MSMSAHLSDIELRRLYHAWVEDQIEEFKAALTRDELMDIAEEAVQLLQETPDEQYHLTELVLRDAVDRLLFARLGLPGFRQWRRSCQIDTGDRPLEMTSELDEDTAISQK
jgi:hypothetical protein